MMHEVRASHFLHTPLVKVSSCSKPLSRTEKKNTVISLSSAISRSRSFSLLKIPQSFLLFEGRRI